MVGLDRPFGMRHHAVDVSVPIADTRNVIQRTVEVTLVTKQNLIVLLQIGKSGFLDTIVTFPVSNGQEKVRPELGGMEAVV